MPQAAIDAATAPCPKCRTDMVLAVIMPHPVAHQLALHTYLCAPCNRTKTYILPIGPSPDSEAPRGAPENGDPSRGGKPEDHRREPRDVLATPASIYGKDGSFLVPCTVRDLSKSGGRLELFKETALPQYFLLSLLPDGSGRRLCSKVWQIALIAGVRFVEKETL